MQGQEITLQTGQVVYAGVLICLRCVAGQDKNYQLGWRQLKRDGKEVTDQQETESRKERNNGQCEINSRNEGKRGEERKSLQK